MQSVICRATGYPSLGISWRVGANGAVNSLFYGILNAPGSGAFELVARDRRSRRSVRKGHTECLGSSRTSLSTDLRGVN